MNLENWEKLVTPNGMYSDPREKPLILRGQIYGHPYIPDGSFIVLDNFAGWSYRDDAFIDPEYNELRLKTPHPSYELTFPDSTTKMKLAIRKREFSMEPRFASRYYSETA